MPRATCSSCVGACVAAAVLLVAALTACSTPVDRPEALALAEVSLPDLSSADAPVQEQARRRHAVLIDRIAAGAPGTELGTAYGELGMLLHAAEYLDSAAPFYVNARQIMPADPRWPYYLGLLYEAQGRPADAATAFERVLALQPEDMPALVRLARIRIESGDAAAAEPLFERARAVAPRSVAVLAGLGQAALARGDYETAVRRLEEGLNAAPDIASLHAPLANAYRALGRNETAAAHVTRWRNTEIPLADPRKQELDILIESGLSYELRGLRALGAQQWTDAAALFRRGIELAPPDGPMRRSLHHKLGTALWMDGDTGGAVEQFEMVTRLAPSEGSDEPAAKAHFSLGVVRASEGQSERAVEHLRRAIAYQPDYGEARLALGDVLRQAGRTEAALEQYDEATRLDPLAAPPRMGYAIALLELSRWAEARAWLDEGTQRLPAAPDLQYLLARVLAAAPDGAVRDGRRALSLAESLALEHKTVAVGETLAMALAESGDYQQAAQIQRGVLEAIEGTAPPSYVARVRQDLQRYERNEPSRTPWTAADPIHPAMVGG